MDLATFITRQRPGWKRLEQLLARAEGSGLPSLGEDEVVALGQLYRQAASDLNQAQTFVSGDSTERYLNDLVTRAYLVVHGSPRADWLAPLALFVRGYPAVFRAHLPHFLLALALLAGGALFGYLASRYDPDAARAFLLPTDMPTIQPGEDDDAPVQSTGEFAAFSAHLFANNVSVSLMAFALGITFGVGSAWLMFYNGVLLGALMAVFAEAGQLLAFATGVLPHGVLEIPAAVLGGAAGFVLAEGMLRARPWPRREELARAGRRALVLVSGCVPLLLAAAALEAGVARAPGWFIGSGLKLGVAGVFGLAFLAYLALPGWGAGSPRLSEGYRHGGSE